jgi:hypothetical protein
MTSAAMLEVVELDPEVSELDLAMSIFGLEIIALSNSNEVNLDDLQFDGLGDPLYSQACRSPSKENMDSRLEMPLGSQHSMVFSYEPRAPLRSIRPDKRCVEQTRKQ